MQWWVVWMAIAVRNGDGEDPAETKVALSLPERHTALRWSEGASACKSSIGCYLQQPMPFATGPWHTPPQLPDDPDELCLVLLFRKSAHYRYAAMRYTGGWHHQNGEALEADAWVSRWAYITSSVQRMSELPPARALPVESRLFVPDALSLHEQVLLLTAYVAELKRHRAALQQALIQPQQRAADEGLSGRLRALENERAQQLASRDARLAEQGGKLKELHEAVQRLTAQATKANVLQAQWDEREQAFQAQRRALAQLQAELHQWKARAAAMPDAAHLRLQIAARDKKIHEQRKALAELEQHMQRLKNRLAAIAH